MPIFIFLHFEVFGGLWFFGFLGFSEVLSLVARKISTTKISIRIINDPQIEKAKTNAKKCIECNSLNGYFFQYLRTIPNGRSSWFVLL